ncbi:MAG: hypothetical protein P1U58_13860 [Verrucomicrobiales bacterium]|nr:hypothetical protein [Verrucomicrobiales bacterium]
MDEYSLKSAGEELAKFADAISQLESRSRSEILFPYIFFASKKMSSRAISRWLSDERGIDFSAASVAKTLRECDKYFALIAERAHILAEHLAEQFDGCAEEILCQPFGMDRIRDLIDQNIPG